MIFSNINKGKDKLFWYLSTNRIVLLKKRKIDKISKKSIWFKRM